MTRGAFGPISIATAPAPPVLRALPAAYTAISAATTIAKRPVNQKASLVTPDLYNCGSFQESDWTEARGAVVEGRNWPTVSTHHKLFITVILIHFLPHLSQSASFLPSKW